MDFTKVSEFQLLVSLHTELVTSEDTIVEKHLSGKMKDLLQSGKNSYSLKLSLPSLDLLHTLLTLLEEE